MANEESLENQYKVCLECNQVSAPGITTCPACRTDNFRPMTKEEKDSPKTIIFFDLENHTRKITMSKGCGVFGERSK